MFPFIDIFTLKKVHELTIQNLQSLNHPVYVENKKMKSNLHCYLGDHYFKNILKTILKLMISSTCND